MRVFHFVNEEFGLENLRLRRLKIATINELNDPFELFGIDLADSALRKAFRVMKDELALDNGLLCFSRDWHNPVQWSHYAAKHTGLCLGFDIPDEFLGCVTYARKRLMIKAEAFRDVRQINPKFAQELLFTKYSHWRYENEVRCFVTLEEKDPEKDLFFAPFSDRLRLSAVIVGAQSRLTRATIREALGDIAPHVEAFKARLAFKTFRVVKQQDGKLWV
jgi:hypothetical protein